MLRIFRRMRAFKSMTDDMHKGQGKRTTEGMPMTGHGSMTEGSSMEEMPTTNHKPMMDDTSMGVHGHQEHTATSEGAFICSACGANFGTRAEPEEHGRAVP